MAPLPPENTARLKVSYQNAVKPHTQLFRLNAATSILDAETQIAALYGAMGDDICSYTISAVEYAAEGSTIFNPVPVSILVGETFGSGVADLQNNAVQLTYVGRTTGGRRSRISWLGYRQALSNYRLTPGEDSDVTAALALINDEGSLFRAIDGLKPVFKSYADVKANDYWVRRAR